MEPAPAAGELPLFSKQLRIAMRNCGIIDPERIGRAEQDFADDPIPIALGVIRDAVGIDSQVDHHPVIDANGDAMFAGAEGGAQVIFVRR